MDRAVCAIFSALNVQPAHEAFLLNMLQITERELRRAKISQMVYQAAFRGVLRIQESDEKFLILVPDARSRTTSPVWRTALDAMSSH